MDSQTMTKDPAISPPSVHLPPAALRLESLEYDPAGNPYYKFPPFLPPPDGVKLIPFNKFKPQGIQVSLDSDQEELDGEGIPTVELSSKHNAEDKDKDKRRKKKKSKKDTDEPKRASPWWEDWAEGEDLRRAMILERNTPRSERFSQGASDFAQNRKFTPILQSLYDHFRQFSGLIGRPKGDKYGKGGDEADDEMADDEAEFDAEESTTTQQAESNPYPAPVIDVDDDDLRIEEVNEETDLRMDMFLNNPEASIKVFFSSYYKDKGLAWSIPKLRDGPILISFFLAFFVRNHIMPDYTREFHKAQKIAEQARIELPQTTNISISLPDVFGRACTALWGSKQPGWSNADFAGTDASVPAPDPASDPVVVDGQEVIPEKVPEPVQDWKTALKERGLEEIDVDQPESDAALSSWGAPIPGETEMVSGWGDGATVVRDSENPWTAPMDTDWVSEVKTATLLQVLGPTTLPLTHSVQRVEKATRRIVAFAPPRADATGLERVLGTVVLAPWKKYCKESTLLRPKMLMDSDVGGAFDSHRDLIRAFISPEVVEVLQEGMGLHGLFVQVLQDEGTDAPKPKRSKGKARGKAKGADDREWWYIEFCYEVIPSFWEEEGDLEE